MEDGEIGGETGQFTVYETRVNFPKSKALRGKVLTLTVEGIDEGLKIQVDGHVVAFVSRSEITENDDRHDSTIDGNTVIPLLTTSAESQQADGSHVIRLTHMNSCDEERALIVSLQVEDISTLDCDRCDGLGGRPGEVNRSGCGCGVSRGQGLPTLALILLAGLFAFRSRRRNRSLGRLACPSLPPR